MKTATQLPQTDPTPLFELFRGSYATELLVSAIAHFGLFKKLASGPLAQEELRRELGLDERAFNVLSTALRAMKLLMVDAEGRFALTPMAGEHLSGGDFDVSGYCALAAGAPGVVEMTRRLRSSRPAGSEEGKGAAFIYKDGLASAMDEEASARKLTLALAGRAKNVAPHLAMNLPLTNARRLLDIGGGTGIYSIAWLQRHAQLAAIIWDRPQVLNVAREMAEAHGVLDRTQLLPGDMFADPVPVGCDVMLLSNVLHDWDVADCRRLIRRCAEALPSGGMLVIHDVFLDDDLGGPLPVALYSAALFSLTQGRAYSAAEYRQWLQEARLTPRPVVPTLVHCGALAAVKG